MSRLKGFTLIELLISVSIFAVIMLCLYSIFSGGIQIWKRQEKGFIYNHTARLTFDNIAKELRNTINYSIPDTATPLAEYGQELKFNGDEKNLTFMTLVGGEIAKVDYVFSAEGGSASGGDNQHKHGVLKKGIVFQKGGFKEENRKVMVLLEGLTDLTFEYAYKASSEDALPVWKDSWTNETAGGEFKIPIGTRITLMFQEPGRKAPEILKKTVFIPIGSLENYKGS